MLSRLLVKRLRTGIRQNSYKDENLTAHEKLRIWKEYLIRKYNNSKYYKIVSIAGKVSLVFGFIGAGKLFLVNDTKAVFNDMYGQVVLITGATSGYGAVVARYAAERGATVIMASRSKSNLMLTEKSILKNCPEAKIHILHLNLADLDSVQKCAASVIEKFGKIDVLINNAGIYKPRGKRDPYITEDGIERTFQVNFLGHYLLTELLKDIILESNGRIISVMCESLNTGVLSITKEDKSSAVKDVSIHSTLRPLQFEDAENPSEGEAEGFKHIESYMQAKLCLYLMMVKWSQEFENTNSVSIGVDPGASNETLFNRYTKHDYGIKGSIIAPVKLWQNYKTPGVENGCQTIVSVMSDKDYYTTKNNGKVLYRHGVEKWENIVQNGPVSNKYFALIQKPENIQLLETISRSWTDLDRRKAEIVNLEKIGNIEKSREKINLEEITGRIPALA